MPATPRASWLDAAPMLLALAATMISLLLVANIAPQRLVVDRLRLHVILAFVSVMAAVAVGVIAVRVVGSRRTLMMVSMLASLPFVPFMLAPILSWVNARFDAAAAAPAILRVNGYLSNGRTPAVKARLLDVAAPAAGELTVATEYPFFSTMSLPPEGTLLRAEVHPGLLGVRWISALTAQGKGN